MSTGLSNTIIASIVTVLACGLGGLPFVFIKEFPDKWARAGWAAAGGLMLAASLFNLIMPGVADAGINPVAVGILLGALTMGATAIWLGDKDIEFSGLNGADSRRALLVLLTLTIHSFPEGVAIGVAFGSGQAGLGLVMMIAIAIHNIPEGLAVSLPLRAQGVSGWKCVGWAIFSSLPQLIAAVPAYLAVQAFRPLLPYAFGFAAGAMIFLVLQEMIPESRATEQQRLASATAGMAGFLFMMLLQNIMAI
ncbi:MAG: ZIP family metal transporter [Anaerolineae bacterium]